MHEGVLHILERSGVKVFTRTGREHFKRAGAEVDEEVCIVRIPRAMVEDAIASAPDRVVLCGRDPRHDAVLEGDNVYLGTGGTAINVLDLETGQRRRSTNEDTRLIAQLIDALENIHIFTINVYPNEIKNVDEVDVNRFYSSLTNTAKHVMGGVYSLKGMQEVIEMASLIAGGIEKLRERPFVSFITLMISPLKIDDHYGEMTCYVASQNLPIVVPTEPLCGTTSPVTLAANVVLHSDMRTLEHLSGAIERGMINAAVSQMAQFYRLPCYSTAGMTDAKVVDCQAGYESAMMNLLVAMSGANYIHDAAGLMEFDLTVSYEKLVIDDEIIGMCLRVLRGIQISDETLALDLIEQVGPGGDFLAQEHTVAHMRTEFFQPTVGDRFHREHWAAAGALDTQQRAREQVRRILDEHQPQGISPEIDGKIRVRFPHVR
jgi:trimethylamine--corrinoid protein Co-methyltransferase